MRMEEGAEAPTLELRDRISVGVVQTTLKAGKAWAAGPPMSEDEDGRAWQEILRALRALSGRGLRDSPPDIIIFPELAVPQTRAKNLSRVLAHIGSIGIVGMDYRFERDGECVVNEGRILIPRYWPERRASRTCRTIRFGKTYPAPAELRKLRELKKPLKFIGDPAVWVVDGGVLGRFGVCVCYDFMDVERAMVYRGRLQHLFVIAYNRDVRLFRALASTLSRTIFCNVVVCNTGIFGGSIAVSPYYQAFERVIFGQDGLSLFVAQAFRLPLAALSRAQQREDEVIGDSGKERGGGLFKNPPPGFQLT